MRTAFYFFISSILITSILLATLPVPEAHGQQSVGPAPSSPTPNPQPPAPTPIPAPWLGVHVMLNSKNADALQLSIPNLAKLGVNSLILEIDYQFEFTTDPTLRGDKPITQAQAKRIGDLCREHHIRPIPQFACLGHQSWGHYPSILLTRYPDLDETPGKYPNNKGIYCRSWCSSNPDVNKKIFPLIDELIAAFGADAFHVGMDEVFLIASPDCPRCKGKNPADLFAQAVNELHDHFVKQKHVEMLMWADRLLDAKTLGYSEWEASENGTFPAVDKIPTDIILCDWHYTVQREYKSIPHLLAKGFRVWPAGWKDPAATDALITDALAHQKNGRMLGYLSTTWARVPLDKLDTFEPTILAAKKFAH